MNRDSNFDKLDSGEDLREKKWIPKQKAECFILLFEFIVKSLGSITAAKRAVGIGWGTVYNISDKRISSDTARKIISCYSKVKADGK